MGTKMLSESFKQSIGLKFITLISGIILFGTIVTSSIIALNEKDMLSRSLETKGLSLASYIAKVGLDPLIMHDGIQLDSIVNEANKDEDVLYVVIRDVQGNPVTSQYASINYRSQKLKAILSGLAKEAEMADIIETLKKNEAIAELSVPIMTGPDTIGKVTIGMSEQKVRHQILMTILFVVALNLAAAFFLSAVLYFASKKMILDPVVKLAHAAARLAEGDLAARVEAKATGEMRMLVDGFNRMAEDLEKRTAELLDAQEELVRKEKLSVLGQLSGSVGHELRNPLGIMSNAVYFLKMVLAGGDDSVMEYLEIIKQEIDNSERIITDLLDFARTKTPQMHAVTPRELVGRSLEKCAFPKNVALLTEIPDTLPQLKVDPLQMGQVFQNLVTNACQAMPGGGSLRIAARCVGRSERGVRSQGTDSEPRTQDTELLGDFIEISVADTGAGIAPENMKRLFQPLFTTKAKGIGLGLVVCRKLVEANGGEIGVDSREGKGTTFTVTLPRWGGQG